MPFIPKSPKRPPNAPIYPETSSAGHERPLYYKKNKIEVWDAIEDWGLGFLDGNVIKYVARAGHKEDRLRDLKKARTYLDKMIVQLEAK